MLTEYAVIMFYIVFIGMLTFFVGLGAESILQNVPEKPTFPTSSPDPLTFLLFVFANIGYYLKILAITSVAYPFLGVFLFAFSVVILYIILKLVRGS
jgi:hypothetical protein